MERTFVTSNSRENPHLMHYVVELCKIYNWRFCVFNYQSFLKVNFLGLFFKKTSRSALMKYITNSLIYVSTTNIYWSNRLHVSTS